MKKVKQILAILGIIFLVSLYIITLVCAFVDNTKTMRYLMASIVATVMIPALIWAYTFIYRLVKGDQTDKTAADDSAADDSE